MHIEGHGDPIKMASALRAPLAVSKTPLDSSAGECSPPSPIELDTAQIDKVIGARSQANGGVYQLSVPRRDAIKAGGMIIPAAMRTANAINFQPTGEGHAAITGDFVITADEVTPLIFVAS
jgi:hypothetical protein